MNDEMSVWNVVIELSMIISRLIGKRDLEKKYVFAFKFVANLRGVLIRQISVVQRFWLPPFNQNSLVEQGSKIKIEN